MAERGRRTLVVETDAYSAMEDLLQVDLADNAVTPVDPPLFAVNLLASECVVNAISRFVPSKRIVRGLLNNRVAKTFFDTAPGVNQFAILDQIRQFLDRMDGDSPRWDHIIVDLPASGHAVTFLSVPQTLRDIINV
ncbi:MAG: ArsA-related P-loop ATPase, partial [Bradymonadaceae bacterium]